MPPTQPPETEFTPIGKRGKVDWKFVLTAGTTDDNIFKKGPGCLTAAVIQVEKMLGVKIQDVHSPLAPRDLTVRARDLLIRQADDDESNTRRKSKKFSFPPSVRD